jgi:hypothetical protein
MKCGRASHRERRHLVEDPPQRGLVAGRLAALAEAVQAFAFLKVDSGGAGALAREVLEQTRSP